MPKYFLGEQMLNIIIVWAATYRFWDLLNLLETG